MKDTLEPEKLPLEAYALLCKIEVCSSIINYFILMKPTYELDETLNRCIIYIKTRIAEFKSELKEYEFINDKPC